MQLSCVITSERKTHINRQRDGQMDKNQQLRNLQGGGGKAEVIIFGWHHTIKSPHGGLLKDIAHLEKS